MTPSLHAYTDLELRILAREADGYPVELTLGHAQEFPRGHLAADVLPWTSNGDPAADGARLFAQLFRDDALRVAWATARGQHPQRRIRLRIDAAAPELHALPWELLRDRAPDVPQDLAAGAATPFSRYLAGTWQPGSPILQRPIRLLVAIANPQNLDEHNLAPIDVDAEWAALQEAVAGLDVAITRLHEPCTLPALEKALREGRYHLLHLIAHGAYNARRAEAALFLADAANQVAVVRRDELATMLARQLADTARQDDDRLRLVFLASCQSAFSLPYTGGGVGRGSPTAAFHGLAPALVQAGVPAVVAMQERVSLTAARDFARTFYGQLLRHGQVDLAANEARAALLTARSPDAAIPVLFMRLPSGQLLGQWGRITGKQQGKQFWHPLLANIEAGTCIAFLGPRVNAGLLPSEADIARKLAAENDYPFPDCDNLARIAQFVALGDSGVLRNDYLYQLVRGLYQHLEITPLPEERCIRCAGFTETADALDWATRVLTVQETTVYHQLADLRLPLYLTTNSDNFMTAALRRLALPVRREGPSWEPKGGNPYDLTPSPSKEQPVVFHLNGHDGDPEQCRHLVLSEDDYLVHFVHLSRDQEMFLPMNVFSKIAENSFLFLGYTLDDWAFRLILNGLIRPMPKGGDKKLRVAVQLEMNQNPRAEQVVGYFERYLQGLDIDIYWGTPQQFVAELHARWQAY